MNNQPLLSICIPSFNRAQVLDQTLYELLNDPDFDSTLIEVIVSDNASSDNTEEVVAKYPIVRYNKNENNVRDANFAIILEMAKGKYLKLFNDTMRLKIGALKKMLDIIAHTDQTKFNILFFNNFFLLQNKTVEINNQHELITNATFYTTWTANFGIWRSDFEKLENKCKFVETQFLQVYWLYKNVANGKKTLLITDDYFEIAELKKKGGYNVFNTFINKYLGLIKQQKISFIDYKIEKYRLFRYFITTFYIEFKNNSDKYDFELNKQNSIILNKYWYELYIYPIILIKALQICRSKRK